jgi:hypothetical protein
MALLLRFAYAESDDTTMRAVEALNRRLPPVARQAGIIGSAHLSAEEQADAQRALRKALDALLAPAPFQWVAPANELKVNVLGLTRRDDGSISRLCNVSTPAGFWFAVVELLEHGATLLRRCPKCGQPHLRRKQYCSPQCSQQVRSARHYAEHRDDVLERRHEAYKRRVRRRHPRAKVARRRRARP